MNILTNVTLLGTGFYSIPEASRLLRIPTLNIRRWLDGYRTTSGTMPPLWQSQLPRYGDHREIGFRDLMELRFVQAFLKAGLPLQTIRNLP